MDVIVAYNNLSFLICIERNHKEDCSEHEQVQNVFLIIRATTQVVETRVCLVIILHNFEYE